MKTNPPNQYRQRGPEFGLWASTDEDGMNGAFCVPIRNGVVANCIISNGDCLPDLGLEVWEHVSLHINDHGKERTPTWDEMCKLKDTFWNEDETVIQYHPKKSNYVNIHPHVLHLWRRVDGFPEPPKICV
jgi:hypothetical protein